MKLLELEFGTFLLDDNYVIGEINEGVHVDLQINAIIDNLIREHYGNQPIGYISRRINDYSVDPLVHQSNLENSIIQTFAVVDGKKEDPAVYESETRFLDSDQVRFFSKTRQAIAWTRTTSRFPIDVAQLN
ncbi:hypothetical protein [Nonlabens ponticola]|uniref:Uncharacterized protein n=1 Tax=Nonlabens ponticola TaxID=2496866 RepID=A0A3S9MZN8_9FLAO|nr:hypothetical protein [Nonlabens ponticola]AZQ44640.1 hypothetical protein EJ995_10465 [Nonlabens ponticola]